MISLGKVGKVQFELEPSGTTDEHVVSRESS